MGPRPVRVLVVDDSALVRTLMSELLGADPGIEVVGTAADPYIARDKIKRLAPDVITLDVEMPRMDGLTFLRNLMRLRPMPVIMVSSLTEAGAAVTLDALAAGAVDFVAKPRIDVARGLVEYGARLAEKVKLAARARVGHAAPAATPHREGPIGHHGTGRLLAIGASTGTGAIAKCSTDAGRRPGHGDRAASRRVQRLVRRVDRHSRMAGQARDRRPLLRTLVAPGGRLRWRAARAVIYRLGDDAPVCHHRPSVDVLFESVAAAASATPAPRSSPAWARTAPPDWRCAAPLTIAQDEAPASGACQGRGGRARRRGGATAPGRRAPAREDAARRRPVAKAGPIAAVT